MADRGGSPFDGAAGVVVLMWVAVWALTRPRVDDWIERRIGQPLARALARVNPFGRTRGARHAAIRQRESVAGAAVPAAASARPRTLSRAVTVLTIGYLALVAWFCLYVPWEQRVRSVRRPLGYSALWDPPVDVSAVVDVNRVVLALVAISALFVAGLVLAWCARGRGE